METRFALSFKGACVDDGRMDAREVARTITGFADLVRIAGKLTYGDAVEVTAQVGGFRRGSFQTDFVVNLIGPAVTLLASLSPAELWEVIKGAIEYWKLTKGEPPRLIEVNDSGATVTGRGNTVINIHVQSLNLVNSPVAIGAARQTFTSPLKLAGVTEARLSWLDAKALDSIGVSEDDAEAITEAIIEGPLRDDVVRKIVGVLGPEFEGDKKWRFTEGSSSAGYTASMLDAEFLERVEAGARFGKGDALEVEMREVQRMHGRRLLIDRSVLKVLRHISVPTQLPLAEQ